MAVPPHLLHSLEDPQQVFSQGTPDLRLCPLSPEQLSDQVWILGHILQPRGEPEMWSESQSLHPGGPIPSPGALRAPFLCSPQHMGSVLPYLDTPS